MDTQKITTSIRLDRDLIARLDAVGERVDRSRSWLTAAAISEFLARQNEDRAAVKVAPHAP